MSILDSIVKYDLQAQVAVLRNKYFAEANEVLERYPALKEAPKDKAADIMYGQFQKELSPHWQKLSTEVRKLVRKAEKGEK